MIAGAFHRTGAVEVWGRGTNRVIEACKRHGTAPPIFEEHQSFLIVTFEAQIVAGSAAPQVTAQVTAQVAAQVTAQVAAMLRAAAQVPVTRELLQQAAGIKHREHFRKAYLEPTLHAGLLERTIPDKPRSRLQKYRLTAAGEEALKERGEDAK